MDTIDSNYKEATDNVYAYDIKGNEIYISDALSGRKGYYCMGCGKEMQAVKTNIVGRMSFFRHDPKAVKGHPKCTYSDETHRHKIAKEILSILKKIKVPPVYKYPPNKQEGSVYLLSESKLIEAHSVGIERVFFEDENGQIHHQKKDIPLDNKFLLIRPDVAFFDLHGNPILLIEIVVTHKISDEKKVKIKRLGIDTIQIRIPKESPQEIEKSFFNTKYSKWIYNNEEQSTDYLSLSFRNSEGISSIDEEQRKLFTESYKCRTAQISNLIRTIERCLESKHYRGIEGELRSELSRVKGNAERAGKQLSGLQDQIKLGVEEEFRERRAKFKKEEQEFFTATKKFQHNCADLETRYTTKARLLESQIGSTVEVLGGNKQSFETRRKNLENEATEIDGDIGNGEGRIEQIQRDREQLENRVRTDFELSQKRERDEIEEIQGAIGSLPNEFEQRENEVRRKFEYYENGEREEIAECEEFEKENGNIDEEGTRGIERKDTEIRAGIIESIKNRDDRGNTEFARRLKELIKNGALLKDLGEAQKLYRRHKKAWECLNNRTYKDWLK